MWLWGQLTLVFTVHYFNFQISRTSGNPEFLEVQKSAISGITENWTFQDHGNPDCLKSGNREYGNLEFLKIWKSIIYTYLNILKIQKLQNYGNHKYFYIWQPFYFFHINDHLGIPCFMVIFAFANVYEVLSKIYTHFTFGSPIVLSHL